MSKFLLVTLTTVCMIFFVFRFDKAVAKRYKKQIVLAIFITILFLCVTALLFPKKKEIHLKNWTYSLIHLEPLPCPALPSPPSNVTITKISVKNSPLFFQQTDILFDSSSEVLSILQQPQHGTFYMESHASVMYDPNYDFVGCDVIRLQKADTSVSPQVTLIDIRITVLISPSLSRHQLDLPKGYQLAEINPLRNSQVRSLFENSEYRHKYPPTDTWYQQRFSSCAIVGNGGVLKGSGHGKEIDSFEAVFRFNAAPIKGFEHDVGSKLDFMWSCSRKIDTCWTYAEGTQDYEERTEHYHLFAQPVRPEHYGVITQCKDKIEASNKNITFHVLSYQWMNLADAILKDYVNDPTLKQDKRRSTGMAVLMAASTVCDSVRLYGFGNSPNGILHYWEDAAHDQAYPIHNFEAEHQFFADMMKGTGIYEKYLWAYNVTSDIQYVH